MAAHVDHQHAIIRRKLCYLVFPVGDVAGVAVDQDERLAAAAVPFVVQADAVGQARRHVIPSSYDFDSFASRCRRRARLNSSGLSHCGECAASGITSLEALGMSSARRSDAATRAGASRSP